MNCHLILHQRLDSYNEIWENCEVDCLSNQPKFRESQSSLDEPGTENTLRLCLGELRMKAGFGVFINLKYLHNYIMKKV